MTRIVVRYHLDEQLPVLDVPTTADAVVSIDAEPARCSVDELRADVLRLRGPGPVFATGRLVGFGVACTWYPGHGAADRVRPQLMRSSLPGRD